MYLSTFWYNLTTIIIVVIIIINIITIIKYNLYKYKLLSKYEMYINLYSMPPLAY